MMKKWRPWGLVAFLSIGMACDNGGVTVKKPTPEIECGPDEELVNGACEQKPPVERQPECRVNDGSCGTNRICVGLDDGMQADAPGYCKEACVYGNSSTCRSGWGCVGHPGIQVGELGICKENPVCIQTRDCGEDSWVECNEGLCVDKAECRIGDGKGTCEAQGKICVSAHAGANEAGTCQTETLGEPCRKDYDSDCVAKQICEANAAGNFVCQHGERDAHGNRVPALSEFEIRIDSKHVVPVRHDGAPVDNPNAGWVGLGTAELKIRARGVGANGGLAVETVGGGALAVATACSLPVCDTDNLDCEWTCTLPAGWAVSGAASSTAVSVRIGLGPVQRWIYNISSELPALSVVAPKTALQGAELRVCVTASTTQVPLAEIQAEIKVLGSAGNVLPGLNLAWTAGALTQGERCWTLPETEASKLGSGVLKLEVSAKAKNIAGNVATRSYGELLVLIGESCNENISVTQGSVVAPLAFSKGHLLFGARVSGNERLFFFDAATCKPAASNLHTGVVQGPMVVLGNTGHIALALGGATNQEYGPAGSTQRLSLVDVATRAFVPNSDCAQGTGGSAADAKFSKGLALVSSPGAAAWQLAAAANTETASVLMAYSPAAANLADRCIGTAVGAPIALTPVQNDLLGTVIAHGSNLSAWSFDGAAWTKEPWTVTVSTAGLLGIALNEADSLWLSANTTPRLQLWKSGEAEAARLGLEPNNAGVSPAAAIDNQSRAYLVGYYSFPPPQGGSAYRLHRLSAEGAIEASFEFPQGTGNVAGSPLLGQPLSGNADAEVYVVSTSGKVFAFKANDLSKLWEIDLGVGVSSSAQPLLVSEADGGGSLWVVGANGQVRSIRVASQGLSHTAPWPKAFRDNCNTSSSEATPTNLSNCF